MTDKLEKLATELQRKANLSAWDGFKFGLGLFFARIATTVLIVCSAILLVLLINYFNSFF